MKKPIFDQWEREMIREFPKSLAASRYEIIKAKRDIGNELARIFKPLLDWIETKLNKS